MRLTTQEAEIIRKTVHKLDPSARIFLHGSRSDPKLRGGDIDLVVHSAALGFSEKISLLAKLKEKLGDQKIDLVLLDPAHAQSDPFWQSIAAHAKEL